MMQSDDTRTSIAQDWSILNIMAAGHILNDEGEALRGEILIEIPYGQTGW
jgi:hypothetical protein